MDDNRRFLEVARAGLEREGLEVVATATTIASALRETAVRRPDVVLVDVTLGDESGFDLARRLVSDFPHLRARIVLISTRDEDDFADLLETSPVAGFLAKPLLSADAVRRLVRSSEP